MAAIDFGTGANTATGDTVSQALAKLQARLDAIGSTTPSTGQSAFTMTQLASPKRVYQRSTTTGGGQSKGTGSVAVTLNVNTAGSIYARCRAADGSIVQAPYVAVASAAVGSGAVSIPKIDARLGWFYLDLSSDGSTWQNGTTLIGMGRVIALSGQSLAVRKMASFESNKSIASFGTAINDNGVVYCTYQDSRSVSTPTWALPADGTGYDSTYEAEFLRLEVPAAGVNCAIVGHSHGGTGIDAFITSGNTDYNSLRAIMTAVEGFEAFIWDHGHANSGDGGKGTYGPKLTTLFNNMTSWNTVRGSSYTKVVDTIPAITNGYGPVTSINALRKDAADWCAANGAIFSCPLDIDLQDGIHPTQQGGIDTARHDYRVLRPSVGLSNDDNGPTLGTATRSGTTITITPSIKSGAKLVAAGTPATRFLVAASGTTSPLAIASAAVADSTITLTLSADPGSTQALDLYFGYPWDPINKAGQDMIRDNVLDSDGLTLGRHLQANQTPVQIAAPGGSTTPSPTPTPTPTPTPATGAVGSSFTASSDITYGTGKFGSPGAVTKGYALSPDKTTGWPLLTTYTIELWIKGNPSGTAVAYGAIARGYIGMADGKALFHWNRNGGETDFKGALINDGNWHHMALVVQPNTTTAYVDGVAVYTAADTAISSTPGQKTAIGAFLEAGDYGFCQDGTKGCGIDEVAVFNIAKYTANFTPPTSAYNGGETGIIGLWHLNGSTLSGNL